MLKASLKKSAQPSSKVRILDFIVNFWLSFKGGVKSNLALLVAKLKQQASKRKPIRNLVIGVPYGWFLLFFIIPFIIVLEISLAQPELAIPPYSEVFRWVDNSFRMLLDFSNYVFLTEDGLYYKAYLSSIKIAFFSTLLCLLIGYPMAWAMSRASKPTQVTLLLLILMPSWTSLLIRVYAWMGILKTNGIFNHLLMSFGLIDKPLLILNTDIAVYIGIVYAYLPFMVLPLYASLVKQEVSLLEAAADLGARPWQIWLKVILPQSKNAVIAGCMLVFIPSVGEFVIPELLGSSNTLMIGSVLWQEFFNNRDWPMASALAVIMLLLLCIPIVIFQYYQGRELRETKTS